MVSSRSSPLSMNLPQPGDRVCWRDIRHAQCLGWDKSYGPGPFEVVRIVDHTAQEIPPGIVVNTRLGEREINSVWLVLVDEPKEAQVGKDKERNSDFYENRRRA